MICRTLFSDVVERGAHYQIAGYDLYLREVAIAVAVLVLFGLLAIRCKRFLQRVQTALAVVLLAGVLVMLLVLTQLRKRQERLESESIRAIESRRAKSRFLFNMSHDLRTPLNAILGFSHLALRPGSTTEEKDESLRKIESAGEQLLGIISDVLDMSLMESGRLELKWTPMSVSQTARDVKALFDGQMA